MSEHSDLIQKAMKDLGLTLHPWQFVFVQQWLEAPDPKLIIWPRQYGRTSISAVIEKIRYWQMNEDSMKGRNCGKGQVPSETQGPMLFLNELNDKPVDPEIVGLKVGFSKGGPVPHASVRQVLAWIDEGTDHAQVTVRQRDWDRLWRVIASQVGEKATLKQRITNQRRQLRGLNRTVIQSQAFAVRRTESHRLSQRTAEARLGDKNQKIARLELELNDAKQAADHAEQALASARTGLEARDATITRLNEAVARKTRLLDYWSDLLDYALHKETTKKTLQKAIRQFDKKRRKEGKT